MQQTTRKALFVIRDNIRTLLAGRKESQTALARYCGHDKSWLNKFLNEGRGLQLTDLDRIAAFFGIEPYQLFQPGISRLTERRSGPDRRSGQERRIGHQNRLISHLRLELNKIPHLASSSASSQGATHAARAIPPSVAASINAVLVHADREIDALLAAHELGQQTAIPRPQVATAPRHRGGVRRSDPGAGD